MRNLTTKMVKRSLIVIVAFVIICAILLAQLFKLQILGYDGYQKEVIDQLVVETNVNPKRGIIYDRNGQVLASNKTVWALYVLPKNIEDPEFIAEKLSEILDIKYDSILEKANKKGYKYQIIDIDVEEENAGKIRKLIEEYNLTEQIQLNASTKRYYPFSTLSSHALGFVNADGIGVYGLEKVYNNILEGTNGKYITAQNAQGGDMPFQYEEYIEDENGYNLVTTIDLYIQYQLESQLKAAAIESGAENRAAGIVMNPQNGEIYAMAVYPSFDLNQPYVLDADSQLKLSNYTEGTAEYRNQYLNLLFSMWNNKAVTELYEPGSTFKLITTSVALQEKVATLKSSFTCTGSLKVDGFYRAISCHKRTGHGTLTFAEALQQSCNPSMMRLAFGIGREKFYNYFKRFGYTGKTGIDLPSESVGYYHRYEDFSNVSLAVYSFGQTFKTTAIQQIRAISAVANGGYLVKPHFIKGVTDNEGNVIFEAKTEKSEQIISTEVADTISQILKEGVDGNGGAKNAYVAGYSIAAKTGTSEKKDKYDENGNTSYRVSSCIAYAPSEDAQVAVIILVDEPSVGSKYGSVVAAPYVANLLELILPYIGIKAEYSETDKEYEQYQVPNYVEKSRENVIKELDNEGITYEIIGNGDTVKAQMPKEGSNIYKNGGKVILYTNEEYEHTAAVPNVIGKTAEEANKTLINSGFNIKIIGGGSFKYGQEALVVWQGYDEGTYLAKGSVITVKVMFTDDKD
ncbi:MAG: PASTA domain-containing protein [Ruminococcaceae bacterium]|nr:PASTA domain-containing protein [Oscillospiraceae bacterium]